MNYLYSTDSNAVHLSGLFNETLDNPQQPLYNNAEWRLDTQSWSQPSHFIAGPVIGQVAISSSETLYLGSLVNAQTYAANNLIGYSNATAPPGIIQSGAYWKNGSSDPQLILAGIFNNTHSVLLRSKEGEWRPLLSNITGQVYTLSVIENTLYIGGNFTSTTNTFTLTSFAMVRLDTQQIQPVAGVFADSRKSPGAVYVIYPARNKVIYVGGAFSYAGSLNCNAICAISSDTVQWNQVSDNISGNVTDIYIDSSKMIAVGSLQVTTRGTQEQTVLATVENSNAGSLLTWHAAAMYEPIQTATSILYVSDETYLVSGQTATGAPVIATWNGESFTTNQLGLDPTSQVDQLTWVPVSSSVSGERYPANTNTLLMAVGHLVIPSAVTNSSAALFDGTQWHPYLLTASSTGGGRIQHVVTASSLNALTSNIRRYLSVPAVVLISLAISLGILFVLMLIAFVYLYFKHKNTPVQYYHDPMNDWKPKHRPTSLIAMLNAANLTDPAASGSNQHETSAYSTALDTGAATTQHRGQQAGMDMSDMRNSSGLSMAGMSFAALLANATRQSNNTGGASEDAPKLYYAKYPFEAKEFGELAFDAHTPVVVTDTSDNVWWMGYKDDGKGNAVSGLFPSNYVTRTKPNTITS